jgi:hypothetical protein
MANVAVSGATSGFNSFLLKPHSFKGNIIFRHIVVKRLFDPKARDHRRSAYLDIEFSVNQIGELGPSAKDLTKQRIMSFVGAHGATMKLSGVQNETIVLFLFMLTIVKVFFNTPPYLGY